MSKEVSIFLYFSYVYPPGYWTTTAFYRDFPRILSLLLIRKYLYYILVFCILLVIKI